MPGPRGTTQLVKKHATCFTSIRPRATLLSNKNLPCQLVESVDSHLYGHATSPVWSCHVTCTDCTVNKFFLPVWKIEQNTISPSYSVCLNPFEVCWVRDDEAYVPVRFEVILSTLNFEQNLIPWITPPHWKAFGPPKDYFQSI
jgi:hypothetical protein